MKFTAGKVGGGGKSPPCPPPLPMPMNEVSIMKHSVSELVLTEATLYFGIIAS